MEALGIGAIWVACIVVVYIVVWKHGYMWKISRSLQSIAKSAKENAAGGIFKYSGSITGRWTRNTPVQAEGSMEVLSEAITKLASSSGTAQEHMESFGVSMEEAASAFRSVSLGDRFRHATIIPGTVNGYNYSSQTYTYACEDCGKLICSISEDQVRGVPRPQMALRRRVLAALTLHNKVEHDIPLDKELLPGEPFLEEPESLPEGMRVVRFKGSSRFKTAKVTDKYTQYSVRVRNSIPELSTTIWPMEDEEDGEAEREVSYARDFPEEDN
jgi:hypothetical protein